MAVETRTFRLVQLMSPHTDRAIDIHADDYIERVRAYARHRNAETEKRLPLVPGEHLTYWAMRPLSARRFAELCVIDSKVPPHEFSAFRAVEAFAYAVIGREHERDGVWKHDNPTRAPDDWLDEVQRRHGGMLSQEFGWYVLQQAYYGDVNDDPLGPFELPPGSRVRI